LPKIYLMENQKTPSLFLAVMPIIILTSMLFLNMLFFEDTLSGPNQTALIATAIICGIIALCYGKKWSLIKEKIFQTIMTTMESILILILIGALSGSWMISGIIPMMIYYGVEIMHPTYILAASVVLCSLISLATGSSWSTIATIGVAIIGIGNAFGLNEGMVAGAIISGAYFGDKMSPMSDTTNLAPAVSGGEIFTHIRYMMITTGPAWILSIIIFIFIGIFQSSTVGNIEIQAIRDAISANFNTSPCLLLVPVVLIAIIIKKMPAIPAMLVGIVLALVFGLVFQNDLYEKLIVSGDFTNRYAIMFQSVFGKMSITTGIAEVDDLLSTGGMLGMLNTVFLIISALIFTGTMDAAGCLKRITDTMVSFVKSRVSLVGSTLLSGIIFNITACDQYLAIVIPGKMMQKVYKEKGYKPEVLSRALEDSSTVTSVLVPWNTCGATQAKVLGVSTFAYLPYCFFNLLSPIINVLVTAMNYKIRKIEQK